MLEKDGVEEIIWTYRVGSEVLKGVREDRNILHTTKEEEKRKLNWIGHILRSSCLLNTLLKERSKWGEAEEEDVSSC